MLLAAWLGLLAVGCGSGEVKHDYITPVSKYKELLPGRWEADDKDQVVQGYEFASDNTLKVTIKGMARPVPGKFSWSAEKELEIEYPAPEEVKQLYAAAVKAYKEPIRKLLASGKAGKGAIGMKKGMDAIPDELPPRETIQVILGEKPRAVLIVTNNGITKTFTRASGG
jgi:hypothetical protein